MVDVSNSRLTGNSWEPLVAEGCLFFKLCSHYFSVAWVVLTMVDATFFRQEGGAPHKGQFDGTEMLAAGHMLMGSEL